MSDTREQEQSIKDRKKLIYDDKGTATSADDTGILTTDTGQFPGKLEEIYKAITLAYGTKPIPPTLLDKIGAAWDLPTPAAQQALKVQLEAAKKP